MPEEIFGDRTPSRAEIDARARSTRRALDRAARDNDLSRDRLKPANSQHSAARNRRWGLFDFSSERDR
jgi:hypothetical protein